MTSSRLAAALVVGALLVSPALAAEKPLAAKKGLPREAGLGVTAIVTNLGPRSEGWDAIKRLAEHRDAKILRFDESELEDVRKGLARIGPEYVVVAVTPTTVDMNFHLDVLELCRTLDRDPMPDFHFGYVTARDGADLAALVDRTLAREAQPVEKPAAGVASATPPGDRLSRFDLLIHFGHGNPWAITKGLTGEQISELDLPRAPIVISGACFTGVLSRSFHPCAYQPIYMAPKTIDPDRLVSLGWVHAGVTGYLAALEGDRGEMALAEYEHLRSDAPPLGDVIGRQYRLAYMTLAEDFAFPRYRAGRKKNMSFFRVMLRGLVSRLLIGDPTLRPLAAPLDKPCQEDAVSYDPSAKTLTVTGTVTRWSQGRFLDVLPVRGDRFTRHLYVRVPLPDGMRGEPREPAVAVEVDGAPAEIVRHTVRHEAWGGRRWLNVYAETRAALGKAGSNVTWTFPIGR